MFAKCPSINAGAAKYAARTNFKMYLCTVVAESARVTRQSQWTHEEEEEKGEEEEEKGERRRGGDDIYFFPSFLKPFFIFIGLSALGRFKPPPPSCTSLNNTFLFRVLFATTTITSAFFFFFFYLRG